MLYIDNLCEFIRLVVDTGKGGILFPQNQEYARTTDIVKLIAQAHGKKIRTTRMFNWLVMLLGRMPGKAGQMVNKAFGNLVYEESMNECEEKKVHCPPYSLEESIRLAEAVEE